PWSTGGGDSPYSIAVHPGDTVLPRGADLKITAELRNFDTDQVEIALRRGGSSEWERWPMTVDDESGSFDFLAFSIDSVTEYLVDAGRVRSAVHRIEVVDLPYVDRIDLEHRFPTYTGLSPRIEEDGGDIAAVAGTEVTLTVIPTMPVVGGFLVLDERDTIALDLSAPDALTGSLRIERNGSYRVVLRSERAAPVVGSPDYYVDVLLDQPPSLRFSTPGRDISVTSIDEVFVEVSAEDDYGVGRVELRYAVNGGPERAVPLYSGSRTPRQLTAGHTFYLEETDLEPGDFLSYYARATDANRVGGVQTTTTDIYFLEIRPFDRRYRQAEAQGGEGAAGTGGEVGELSSRQRQIVAATFKVVRDSSQLLADEVRENLATLALAQGRLREEVQTLVDRMESRRVVQLDSTFQAVAEALPQAAVAMQEAEERLGERRPQDALSPEQRALQFLQRAEAAFREREVTRGGNQQGGGGQSASAEDLADLFDLEMDKLRNQYEQVDRGERRETSQQVDEILEKLRELARRQQQENERMRAQAQSQGGGGGSEAQRRLADETEEAARRLERLSREQSRPDLEQTARRLREAAEAMRRAAATRNADGTARGQSALDDLRDARRRLEQSRSAGGEGEIRDALRRAEQLSEQQQDVRRDVERLEAAAADRDEQVRRLVERKNQMADEVRDLEAQLAELARTMREEQKDAARRLGEAAREMRDQRLADKILFSRGVVQDRSTEYARNFEEQIGADLENLEQRIRDALDAVGDTREQRLGQSLDRARDLVNALESLDERLRAAAEPQQPGREGQESPQQGQGQETSEPQGGEQPGREQSSPQGMPRGGGTGQLSPDDVRQFRGELGRRRNEMAELRRELAEEDVDVAQLDRILRGLGTLQNRGTLGDPRGLAQLQAEIIAGLKEFEFALRRELAGTDEERLFLSGSDDVPEAYRKLVEEYYKALSRSRR
ncbi:MAG: hypothetical protein OEO20_15080, partial [Gemmatimonadota bacterium]|nr:hypothetical protein [Gemmatimonadota bacterium]